MNFFDAWIMSLVGDITQQSAILDALASHLKGNNLVKGGVVLSVYWWLWFSSGPKIKQTREVLLATLLGAFGAVATAKVLAVTLPFRFRPRHDPDLDFQLPIGAVKEALDGWSSFPSDHGAMFFALAAGLFFISRRAAYGLLAYVTLFIAVPRVYTGMHYPTDIAAGAIIGVVFALVFNLWRSTDVISGYALRWLDRHPASFYAGLFLLTMQVATLFDGVRGLASFAVKAAKMLVS